ncbi:MAG: glycosyltransferase family 39 protein [candidate division KSB1 bacterium]|nr:glycosyltransferase family 39 protein [candidate division KSB1 bacterium]
MKQSRFWSGKGTRAGLLVLAGLFVLRLAVNLVAAGKYGFHREELVNIDLGNHLAWGYLGKAPGIALVAKLGIALSGSPAGYRVLPIAVGLLAAWLSMVLVKQMGGGQGAKALVLLGFVLWPVSLRASAVLWPTAFDLALGSLVFLLLMRALRNPSPWAWLLWGVVWGLSVLLSYGVILLGVASIVGVALSRERALLRKPWPWLGFACGLVLLTPHLAWLQREGFSGERATAAVQAIWGGTGHGVLAPALSSLAVALLALAGLFRLLFRKAGRGLQALGWTSVCVLGSLVVGLRPHTVAAALVPLVAAGGVALEQMQTWPGPWLRRVVVAFVLVVGLVGLPLSLPVLPADTTSRYAAFLRDELGVSEPLRWEDGHTHELPQDFADMLGWDSQVATVGLIYGSLPPELKEQCVIVAADRGQAAAVNVLGPQYSLPRAVSTDGDYYRWGPGRLPGEVLIAIGMSPESLASHYDVVETAASVVTRFARQGTVHVLVCAQPRMPLPLLWPRLRQFTKR